MTGGDFVLLGTQWLLTILLNRKAQGSTAYAIGLVLPLTIAGVALTHTLGGLEISALTVSGTYCMYYGWFAATSFWIVVSGHYLHTTKKGRPDLRYKDNPYLYTFAENTRAAAWRACIPSAAMFVLFVLIGPIKSESAAPKPTRPLAAVDPNTSSMQKKLSTPKRK